MGSKGQGLAEQFERANAEFVQTLEGLSDDQWKRVCAGEEWPVATTAHHVAEDHNVLTGLIKTLATGGQLPPIDAEALNGINAEHAKRVVGVTREETIALARSAGQEAAAMVRDLSDEQLAKSAMFPAAGGEVTAGQLIENILIGHIGMHLPSIKDAAQ